MQKHARLEVNNMRAITEGGNCAGTRDFLARTYLNNMECLKVAGYIKEGMHKD